MMKPFEKKEKKFYHMKQAFDQKELHEREGICTRLEPPQCQAGCPIHVDVRALMKAVSRAEYDKGYAIIKSAVSFVNLIARKCEAPCLNGCVLKDKGSIRINTIEKACAAYGKDKPKSKFLLPRKNKKAAVLGTDLFALACCAELGEKGYEVHFFGPNPRDILLKLGLSEAEAKADLAVFDSLRVSFIEETSINAVLLNQKTAEYEALCMSHDLRIFFQQTELPQNVFWGHAMATLIDTLCAAKSIALDADRFMQGVQTEQGRQREGTFVSTLYVSADEIRAAKAYERTLEASLEQKAVTVEAARCIQCECTECIKGCAFLQHYKSDPRKTIREIYNNASIVMGDHHANHMINSCSECGQCAYTCPNGFDLSEICKRARQAMAETGKMPPSTHEFALLDLSFSNQEAFLALPQPGFDICKYAFFPGCQAMAVSPAIIELTYRDLCERLEGGVALILGCCGAIADWAGNEAFFDEAVAKIVTAWEELKEPEMIVSCPSCMKVFLQYAQMEPTGIWDVLNEIGLPKNAERESGRFIIHDSCGARGNERIQDAVRQLIRATGREAEDSAYTRNEAPCCGYGGLTAYANPELAVKMSEFFVADRSKSYISYCMACKDRFRKAGADSLHILELVYGRDETKPPGLSARRNNRLQLKSRLLKTIWGEEVPMKGYDFVVHVDEALMGQIEERMILMDDIYQVFEYMRESGNAVLEVETGFLSTSARIGNVTFWVKYQETADGYCLKGAYSHRMIVEV